MDTENPVSQSKLEDWNTRRKRETRENMYERVTIDFDFSSYFWLDDKVARTSFFFWANRFRPSNENRCNLIVRVLRFEFGPTELK